MLLLHEGNRIERVIMKPPLFFIIGLALVYPVFGQVTGSDPHYLTPEIGWDSLQAKIEYPELARRAGLEGTVDAVVYINASGIVDSIRIQSTAEIFVQPVEQALRSTKWVCPKSCASNSIEIPVNFFLHEAKRHPLYKGADRAIWIGQQ